MRQFRTGFDKFSHIFDRFSKGNFNLRIKDSNQTTDQTYQMYCYQMILNYMIKVMRYVLDSLLGICDQSINKNTLKGNVQEGFDFGTIHIAGNLNSPLHSCFRNISVPAG